MEVSTTTNGDKIRSMTDEELREKVWINFICRFRFSWHSIPSSPKTFVSVVFFFAAFVFIDFVFFV